MHTVALSLGSNITPEPHLREALDALQARYGHLRTSSVFESESVGFSGANFLNMVALIETEEALPELAQFLKVYEDAHGRQRARPKFSGRTVDIDILTFGEASGVTEGIQLPRAEIVDNAYVLWPLSQVCFEEIHPVTGRSYGALWADYDKQRQKLWSIDFKWQGRWISRAGLQP